MWLFIAGSTALLEATKDIYHSQQRYKRVSPLLKAWVLAVFSWPVMLVYAWSKGVPRVGPHFWPLVSLHAILVSMAHILYMRALVLGPLSQTQPILALTTIFLAVTNPLMTNERISIIGWIGVICVGVGVYATQYSGMNSEKSWIENMLSPIKEMSDQPGVIAKLGVALIYSITSNLDRLCIEQASGPFYVAIDTGCIVLILSIVVLISRALGFQLVDASDDGEHKMPTLAYLFGGGLINALSMSTHVMALMLAPVPYVIAVKRLSILFASAWSYLVRKDRMPHWFRVIGAIGVVLGIALICFWG